MHLVTELLPILRVHLLLLAILLLKVLGLCLDGVEVGLDKVLVGLLGLIHGILIAFLGIFKGICLDGVVVLDHLRVLFRADIATVIESLYGPSCRCKRAAQPVDAPGRWPL